LVTKETAPLLDQMKVQIALFEHSQNIDDYMKVKNSHMELRKKYKLRPEDLQTNISSAELINSGFSDFPQIATNDYVIDQLNLLKASQDNLNSNLENVNLAQQYIDTNKLVQDRLHTQYSAYWNNPF